MNQKSGVSKDAADKMVKNIRRRASRTCSVKESLCIVRGGQYLGAMPPQMYCRGAVSPQMVRHGFAAKGQKALGSLSFSKEHADVWNLLTRQVCKTDCLGAFVRVELAGVSQPYSRNRICARHQRLGKGATPT